MTGMTQCDQIFLNVGSQVRPKLFMVQLRDSNYGRNPDIASRLVEAPSDKVAYRHAVLGAAGTLCHARLSRSLESQSLRKDAFLLFRKEREIFLHRHEQDLRLAAVKSRPRWKNNLITSVAASWNKHSGRRYAEEEAFLTSARGWSFLVVKKK